LYPVVVSAAGKTEGNAADNAAVEQIPFMRALLEKSELIAILSSIESARAVGQRIHFTSFCRRPRTFFKACCAGLQWLRYWQGLEEKLHGESGTGFRD
jgi:hypothetical protein